ncbi:hypothetical protein HKD37_09G024912 [Glycine soja]
MKQKGTGNYSDSHSEQGNNESYFTDYLDNLTMPWHVKSSILTTHIFPNGSPVNKSTLQVEAPSLLS